MCTMKFDRDSMWGDLTLTNKPDFKAFKFGDNSQGTRTLQRDTKSNLAVVKKQPQVNDFMPLRDSLPIEAYVTPFSAETKWSKESKRHYSKKTLMDSHTPELVAFFHEHNYQFVKDIFMDKEMSSLKKNMCLVENCELDHKNISCMLNSDVDNDSESTNRTIKAMSSMSDELKLGIENESGKDVMMEDEDGSDDKIVPQKQLFPKAESREADDNNHTSDVSSESEVESGSIIHHSDSSTKTVNSKEEFQQKADFETENDELEKSQSLTVTGLNQNFVHQHDQGLGESNSFSYGALLCSEQVPYSGSISLRSNSSTSSSLSFAFPILASEWNGSPVRMVKADGRQLRKQQNWRMCFLCCKF